MSHPVLWRRRRAKRHIWLATNLRLRSLSLTQKMDVQTVAAYIILVSLNFCGTWAKEDIDIDLLGRFSSALAVALCPEGIDRCECANKNNTFTKGPFDYDEDPIGVSLEQLTCAPDFCYCKDTPTVRRDGRPAELAALMDLCPRHMMHRCLCHDNSIVKFPFDMTSVFFTCRPKKCKCIGDSKPKKLTGMGCKNGGMPWCPYTNKRQTDSVCRNGDPMYMNGVLKYREEFRSDCICKDGFSPRCRETNSWKKCPDGEDYDPSADPWGGYAQRCDNNY